VTDALLTGLAETARAVFGARAASIMVHDAATDELVFRAVSGEGADTMPGRRVPASAGIAGWVLRAEQPLTVEDVTQDPRFAADFARSTGYMPKGIMAAPVLDDDAAIGVVSVLDRPRRAEFSLIEVELLERFCHLVGLTLREEGGGAAGGEAELSAPVADLAGAIAELPPRRQAAAERLLDALTALLES
jgi:GAF domain-containing protein